MPSPSSGKARRDWFRTEPCVRKLISTLMTTLPVYPALGNVSSSWAMGHADKRLRVLVRISCEPLAGDVVLLLVVRGTRAVGRAPAQAGFSCWQAHGVTMQELFYPLPPLPRAPSPRVPGLSGILRSGLCGWRGVGLGDSLFISLPALLRPPGLQDPLCF